MWRCVSCGIGFATDTIHRQHYKSDWHRYNLRRRAAGREPIDEDEFNHLVQLLLNASTSAPDKGVCHLKVDVKADTSVAAAEKKSRLTVRKIKSHTEYQGPEACLFDRRISSDIQRNILYMKVRYSFFIPNQDDLLNVVGFLRYLREYIEQERKCLYCSRTFAAASAVRKHMVAVGHTNIGQDNIDLQMELAKFYCHSDANGSSEELHFNIDGDASDESWEDVEEHVDFDCLPKQIRLATYNAVDEFGDLKLWNGKV